MAVAEVQAALARLSTDPAARALLLSDPAAFARAAGLSPEEMKGLMTTADSSLHVFALSLLHKRSHEAARSIPRTRAAIGEPFREIFEAYAATAQVKHDPAQDARGFLRWLLHHGRPNVAVRDCALYESAALQMQRSHRRFKMGLFTLPSAPTRFLAVWWRVCRQQPCRYFQWPRT